MKKYWSLLVLSVCAVSVPFVYQNCSPASFQYNPSSDAGLVVNESTGATSTGTQLDEQLFQQICVRLGGTYNPKATSEKDKCSLNLMSANDMSNMNSRFCQEVLNGVWDPNKTPACALPYVSQQVFDQAKQDLQNQIDQLKNQLGQIDTINAKLDDLQKQINDRPTKAELLALQDQITQLQKQFDALDLSQFASKTELQASINSINSQISDIQSQLGNLSTATNLNTRDISKLNTRVDELQTQINSLVDQYNSLTTKFDDLAKLVAQSQLDIEELKKNSVTKDELAALKTEMMTFINDLKAKVEQLNSMDLVSQSKLNEVLAPIIASYKDLLDQVNKLKETSVTQDQLQAVVNSITNKYNELQLALQTLSSEVASHTVLLADLKQGMVDLNKIVEDLKNNSVTQDQLKQVVSNFNQQISELIMQINSINQGQAAQDQKIADLLQQLTDLRSLVEKHGLSIDEMKKIIDQLNSKISSIDTQLLAVIEDLKKVSDQTTTNTQTLASLQSAITSLEMRIKGIEANGVTQEQLTTIVGSLRQDIDTILAKLVVLQSVDDEHTKLITQLIAQISQLNQAIIQIKVQNTSNFEDVIRRFANLVGGWSVKIIDYIHSVSDLDDQVDQFYSMYSNSSDQQICESLGGVYDANSTDKCKLNIFNQMTLQKRVKMNCMNSNTTQSMDISCPSDFKLVACSGRGGIETGNQIKGTIAPDFVNKRCVLKVDKPTCDQSNQKSFQRVVAVCAKIQSGGRCGNNICPSGMNWNSQIKRCEQVTCPMNYALQDNKCVPLVPVCPSGSSYDPGTGKCYSMPRYCPQGYLYDSQQKKCVSQNI